ncbi:hypothetical protein [Borreliella burgdorferi]|nr:hypothetical protein [Borreliella burgdorferi]
MLLLRSINGKENNDVDVIVGAVFIMAYNEFEGEFKRVKDIC